MPDNISPAELAAAQLNATAAPSTPPAAPSTPAAAPAAPGTVQPGDLDSLNRAFDPAKYLPKKDSLGRWVNANAGRKPKTPAAAAATGRSFVAPDAEPAAGPAPAGAPAGAQGDRFDLAAEMYCRAGYSTLDGIFSGDGEWLPENDGEHVALRGAVATYLRHKQADDLPPGLALALAVGTYAAKRTSKPRTLSRIRFFAYWVKSKIYAWRTGRSLDHLPPPPPAPPAEQRPLPPQNLPHADSSPAPDAHRAAA